MKRFTFLSMLFAVGLAVAASSPRAQDTLTGFTGTVTLQGSIQGAGTADIRAYRNGLMVASAAPSITGGYNLRVDVDGGLDETVVIWFIPDNDKVPEILLLKESSLARRNNVWHPCVPRLKADASLLYDVNFLVEKDYLQTLADSDCWDEG